MDKEQSSIELIKMAADISLRYYKKPIVCTYSGGKDSDVLLELFLRSGVIFEVHNSHTTADAPQTVYHIREKFRQLDEKGIKCTIGKPKLSMWQLIPQKKIPPTRLVRYCCSYLKETACKNRLISTGVRWDESNARRERGVMEIVTIKKKDKIVLQRNDIFEGHNENRQLSLLGTDGTGEIMLMSDNSEKRLLFEQCLSKEKSVCNPIVNWKTQELWDYIESERIMINPLYEQGFTRIGCIGCPMAGRNRYFEFSVFPKYKQMYLNSFKIMLHRLWESGAKTVWRNEHDVFKWWMEEKILDGQISIEDFD